MSGIYKRKFPKQVKVWGLPGKRNVLHRMPEIPCTTAPQNDSNPDIVVDTADYQHKMLKLAGAWEELRAPLMNARVDMLAPPETFQCVLCYATESNIIRCLDCGIHMYLCSGCSCKLHTVLYQHCPDIWNEETGMFLPVSNGLPTLAIPSGHEGHSVYKRTLCIFDQYGKPIQVNVQFCPCEKDAVTLIRHNLWAVSPQVPTTALDVKLLELYVALQMECHTSASSFVAALQEMEDYRLRYQENCPSLVRAFGGEVISEYRYNRTMLSSSECLGDNLGIGPDCEICLQVDKPIICLDGNFGLVHKNNAGMGQGTTRHKNLFFLNQESLRKYVDDYALEKKVPIECSDFIAGNALRSKNKNKKLTYKGLFGSVCRHDMPLKFVNLEHGERLAYSIFLLRSMLGGQETNYMPVVMYDIACILHKHLKKTQNEQLLQLRYCLPVFHSFAHKLACKLEYGQRFTEGTGLSDGEGMERLWSYLRPFAKITKEMTERNREDLLSDALLHYAIKNINKQAEKLSKKMCAAKAKMEQADSESAAILAKMQATDEDTDIWRDQMLHSSSSKKHKEATPLETLHATAVERQHLLLSIKKYADGQSIAIRLSKQLGQCFKKMKKHLEEVQSRHPDINVDGYMDPSSPIYSCVSGMGVHPDSVKAIELVNFRRRCQEEVSLLGQDMNLFYQSMLGKNINTLTAIENCTNRGLKVLLTLQKLKIECILWQCCKHFHGHVADLSFNRDITDKLYATSAHVYETSELLYLPNSESEAESSEDDFD